MIFTIVIEHEAHCEIVEYPTFNEAVFWSRYYMLLPGVWSVWITDDTWGHVLYENGVCVDL